MNSRQYLHNVSQSKRQAQDLGCQGTPTTFVVDNRNGKSLLMDGSRPKSEFAEAIEALLKG